MRKIITFILYSKTHLYYGAGIPLMGPEDRGMKNQPAGEGMARKEKKKAERGGKQGKGAPQPEKDVAEQQLSGPKSFLYVGGRDCQVAHLRQIASNFGAELIHHDGGLREAVSRIDTVLPSVDCVFCPIDCISHDACLRVKSGCKKFGKTFIPLRNGSKSSLERALQTMNERTPNDERRAQ
ncbi:hypothetical protein At1D132_20680 [Agrobacterium fabrum]|nr:hypothetical protein At1D132_20680 [Agrobacterium fabrum]AYM63144.1 hypothetical protein At12D13_19790 [Agrobacterium fabrum]MDH6295771.1 hypothetical protein [Agrobacterium fabrum]